MNDQLRLLIIIISAFLFIVIVVVLINLLLKRKKLSSHIEEEKKLYDLQASSANVQLFGIDTKSKKENNSINENEDLIKTQIISLSDSNELERIAEVKEISTEDDSALPKLK